ncbi:hypothetical protein BDZ89DRAFT_1128660 [Hymenopellis radicata]|nr:hypothetical protein BDZ89DRAFT_1128660 [Hymenopellis radicata]
MLITFVLFLLGIYLFLVALWHILTRHHLAFKSNALDFEFLRTPRCDRKIDGTAVICGEGLFTAKICDLHFRRVVIVEPEAWLATDAGRGLHSWEQVHTRTRVAQYKSLHGNQETVSTGLLKLFPGFEAEAKNSGLSISEGDVKASFAGTRFKLPYNYYPKGLPQTLYGGRQALETLIRQATLAGLVTGLVRDPQDPSRVSEVIVRTDNGTINLDATLAVDCTGVTRAGFKWLDRLGYGQTAYGGLPLKDLKISLDQKLQYTTMIVTLTPDLLKQLPIPGDGATRPQALFNCLEDIPSQGRRFFVMWKQEGNDLLFFGGQSNDSPPRLRCLDDMLQWVRSLTTFRDPVPDWVYDTLEMCKKVENTLHISQIRVPGTAHIRYHLAADIPSNFIAIGDSVMSVNPTFAQGSSKAFMGAVALNNTLRKVKTAKQLPDNFSKQFFAQQHTKIDGYWQQTRLMDYGIPSTIPIPGESLSSGAWFRAYIRRLQLLATTDDHAALAMYNGIFGVGTPLDPLHPALVVKVLWGMLKNPSL